MTPLEILSLTSAAGFLAIAVVAAVRRAKSPVALKLGLMCMALFAYNALEAAASITGEPRAEWLEDAAAALCLPPTFNLLVGFVGMSRRLRWPLRALAACYIGLALASVGAFAWPPLELFTGSSWWAACMLAGMVPGLGASAYLLVRHARRSSAEERARCQLLGLAALLGLGGAINDLVAIAGLAVPFPMLSHAGFLAAALLVAALVLKARVFERTTTLTMVSAAVASVLAIIAQLIVVAWAGTRIALLVFGTGVVVLALVATLRPLLRTLSEHRERNRYLATLGRFSVQMAHDLRNPVAAIHGAAQFLQEERTQGRSLDPHVRYLDLILERTERLERVIRDYQRMGRVEPVRAPLDVNELVETLLAHPHSDRSSSVQVRTELESNLPPCQADRDLLAAALENLVRNAREAMSQGGEIVVSTQYDEDSSGGLVRIRVRDTGPGMDVHTQERAFVDFFSTKSQGSGLGLAFAARVAEAHGGRASLESREGAGTTVEIEIPVGTPADAGIARKPPPP